MRCRLRNILLPVACVLALPLLPVGAGTILLTPEIPGYVHEVFGVEDGLPRAGTNQMVQTRDGYLWIATYDGLARFDGARFEIFDSDRIPALGSNRLSRVAETGDGTLWIVSEQGHLTRYRNGRFTACDVPRSGRAECGLAQGGGHFRHVVEGPPGTVWVSGEGALYRLHDGHLLEETSVEDPGRINALYPARDGRLWVGAEGGLWVGRPGRFSRLPLGKVLSVAEDGQGQIWVGTPEGVGRLVRGRWQREVDTPGWVALDARGTLWVFSNRRLLRLRGGELELVAEHPRAWAYLSVVAQGPDRSGAAWVSWYHLLIRDGRPVLEAEDGSWWTSLLVDRDGTVWAAGGQPGVLRAFHPERVTTLHRGMPDPNLLTVFEDRDGTLWAGRRDSLAILDPERSTFQPLDSRNGGAWAMLRDTRGTLWVGNSRGLFVLEEGRLLPVASSPPWEFRSLLEDQRGDLWAGTNHGLLRHDARHQAWVSIPCPWAPQGPRVRVIHEGSDRHLWLGTDGHGVVRYDRRSGHFLRLDRSRGLSSDLVRSLWTEPGGRLWIGTENGGLNRLDPRLVTEEEVGEVAVVGREQGLPSAGVHRMLDDERGNLWMSTNDGIFRAKIADLNAVAEGRLTRLETVGYNERDGMRNREANGGVQQAGLRDRQGRLWFPTLDGMVRIDPAALLVPADPPPVQIESVWVGEEELPQAASGARLAPEQRSFRILWSAPYFRAPDRLRFRYRLRGYEDGWNEAGNRREAFYTRVPPGRYTFEVAVALEGVWSDADGEAPAALDLEVIPRFFETGLFRASAGIALLLLLGLAFLLWDRRRQARQQERERALEATVQERTATIREQAERLLEMDRLRAQFFANVSHEFRTPLTLILGPARDVLQGGFGPVGRQVADQITLMERNAGRLLNLVDQLLQIAKLDAGRFALKLQRGDLEQHLRRRVENFVPLAERLGVHLEARLPKGSPPWTFDPQELAKVFDNLLSNALKFTPRGGAVRVSLEILEESEPGREAREARIAVEDEGPGIPTDQRERIFDRFQQGTGEDPKPGFGLGLALARQLTELHGGTLTVADSSGPRKNGARFVVTLPETCVEEAGAVVEAVASSPSVATPRLPDPAAAEPAAAHRSPDADPTERATLLVVDDNADIRAYLRRHLESRYEVVEAVDGMEGLREARGLQPDLIISDVMMPGLDGNDLLRTLRRDARLMLVPVILVTAKASKESRLAALREGVDDYLIKPFDPRELLARVENLLLVRRRLLEHIRPPRGPLRVSEIEITPADEAFLERVRLLVEENLGEELTVEGLAGLLGCDRSYLLRKLRTLTGETPSELIRSFRLQRAEQLLKARAGAVTDVAYAVGFKTVAHFSNAFLDRYGERPSVFVERQR
jgi:signal transduction histidine kinase/ligand-binding sensor domain-containing protein/DNA-binding response OmpR family regulator